MKSFIPYLWSLLGINWQNFNLPCQGISISLITTFLEVHIDLKSLLRRFNKGCIFPCLFLLTIPLLKKWKRFRSNSNLFRVIFLKKWDSCAVGYRSYMTKWNLFDPVPLGFLRMFQFLFFLLGPILYVFSLLFIIVTWSVY